MSIEPITKPARAKPANDAVPHVIRAINAVSSELASEGIAKGRKNAQQGYSFRGIDEVLNTLSRLLAEHKLVIVPRVTSREIVERQTKNGGALFSVTVAAEYTFVSAEDGTQFGVGPFYGEAMDSADKATNKAMSAAYKYMAIQTFCIPTEGDNDADATTHEVVAGAAGAANPPPRQQLNSSQAKKENLWPVFVEKLRGFDDLNALEEWWAKLETKRFLETLPNAWQAEAAEEYEKQQERLADKLQRELDEERR